MYEENEPGLSYDQQAYQWAFHAPSGSMNDMHAPVAVRIPIPVSKASVKVPAAVADDTQPHAAELERLSTLVGRWSLFLAVVMLTVILVGQFALNRTIGPFVVIDIFLCAVFAFGALSLRAYERTTLLRFLHIYFALNAIVLIASVPVSIYQLTNNPTRIDSLCVDRGGCTADEHSRFLTYSYVAGALGLAVWFVLSTTFLRTQFVLMCALERAHQQSSAVAIHPAIRLLAAYLPDWAGLFQSCTSRCGACVAATSESCSAAGTIAFKAAGICVLICVSVFFAPLAWAAVGWVLFKNMTGCGDKPEDFGALLGALIGSGLMLGISSYCDSNHITGGAVCSTAKIWTFVIYVAGCANSSSGGSCH